MKFKEHDIVKVTKHCNIIEKGQIGVVLICFEKPNEAYEVEFADLDGHLKAQYTFLPDELEKLEISSS